MEELSPKEYWYKSQSQRSEELALARYVEAQRRQMIDEMYRGQGFPEVKLAQPAPKRCPEVKSEALQAAGAAAVLHPREEATNAERARILSALNDMKPRNPSSMANRIRLKTIEDCIAAVEGKEPELKPTCAGLVKG